MDILRFMTAGSVDDGKSTLIGRLFHDAGLILQDQLEGISKNGLNLAFFTDGLKEERELGITIDVAYRYFEIPGRRFMVADSPGHFEFTRNMVTAASHCDLVFILVDGPKGVSEQTIRHHMLAKWVGDSEIIFLVNKMDILDYDEKKFEVLKSEIQKLGPHNIIPVSALAGDNVFHKSEKMKWYEGKTLWNVLRDSCPAGSSGETQFQVQLTEGTNVLGVVTGGEVRKGQVLKDSQGREITIGEIEYMTPESVCLTVSAPLLRGEVLTPNGISKSARWEIEFCLLLDSDLSELTLLHSFQSYKVKNLTIDALKDFVVGNWKGSPEKIKANEIYSGKVELDSQLTLIEGGRAVFVDLQTGMTIAAIKLIRALA